MADGELRAFSYGGGVQSTAALVLAARGVIDFPLFCFANVGEDSELPATLRYVQDVAIPYAEANGVELVEVRRTKRDGTPETLVGRIKTAKKSVPIPVRMGHDGAPGNRTCTADFKIRVIEKELKRRGATEEKKATVGLGISLDEWHRAGSAEDPRSPVQLREYPLLEARITRDAARQIILDEGLPMPQRSACFFCPFHSREEWRRLARLHPDKFAEAVQLERILHDRGKQLGRGEFFLTRYGVPLDELFDGNELTLFEDEADDAACDAAGYCMT